MAITILVLNDVAYFMSRTHTRFIDMEAIFYFVCQILLDVSFLLPLLSREHHSTTTFLYWCTFKCNCMLIYHKGIFKNKDLTNSLSLLGCILKLITPNNSCKKCQMDIKLWIKRRLNWKLPWDSLHDKIEFIHHSNNIKVFDRL